MGSIFDAAQTTLTYLGSFVLVLSLVVFVHEWGHFQAARLCRVAVDTFSIGFGRSLATWRDKSGVVWKIGALPLGGYVKFAEDADGTSMMPVTREPSEEERREARRRGIFYAQPLAVRAFVVVAGPLANFIFAIAAFAAILMAVGRDTTDVAALSARVTEIEAGSPAAQAGLRPGDVVAGYNGMPVTTFDGLRHLVAASTPGQTVRLDVRRGGESLELTATVAERTERGPQGQVLRFGRLGIGRSILPEERTTERFGPIQAVALGAGQTWSIVARTGQYVGNVFRGAESADQLSGPIGILNVSGRTASAALSGADESLLARLGNLAHALVTLAAIISVAVGIVNLLPIPILDGGHLLFYAIEALRGGRPLPLIAQEWAFRAGLVVMGSLFLFATWNDISRHLANLG